jgi:hypothetical protein
LSEVQHIRFLVKQAGLYRAHGLLAESREKYEEILSFLRSNPRFQNADKITEAIQQRLEDVDFDIRFRDLNEKVFDLSESAFLEYSDSLGCTRNMGYSWMRRFILWTITRINNLRSKYELLGKKRILS